MMPKHLRTLTLAVAPLMLGANLVTAGDTKVDAHDQMSDEAKRAVKAGEVLHSALSSEDGGIPRALLENAHGIIVVPHVVKGAFMVGGQYGKGLAAWRGDDGEWNAPSFVSIGGASYGFQAGVEAVDLVLVVNEEDGIEAIFEDGLKLGATMGVTAGPIGRRAELSTNVTLDAGIYSYSQSKGIFAGAALDGAVLTIDSEANQHVYGEVDGKHILTSGEIDVNDTVSPFYSALENLIPDLDEDTASKH